MRSLNIDDTRLKDIIKIALVEVLHEQKAFLGDIVEEIIEDESMSHAINKGLKTKDVSRTHIMEALKAE